jgi:hypothetical protein
MKRKYLSFALGLTVAVLIVISMVGCKRTEPPKGPSGGTLVSSKLIAETEGCRIYRVDTWDIPADKLYLTKCEFNHTASVGHEYTEMQGKMQTTTTETNITVESNRP